MGVAETFIYLLSSEIPINIDPNDYYHSYTMSSDHQSLSNQYFFPKLSSLIKELLFIYILVFTLLAPSSSWKTEFGDGREYMLQTQSIVLDRSVSIDPLKRGSYFNETNPFGIKLGIKGPYSGMEKGLESLQQQGIEQGLEQGLQQGESQSRKVEERDQYGGGFGGLYPALDSSKEKPSLYFIHSWIYSAATVPIYICTKFFADLFSYLGGLAVLVVLGLAVALLLFSVVKRLTDYANRLSGSPNDLGSYEFGPNLSFHAALLTIAGLIAQPILFDRIIARVLEYQAFYLANIIFFSASLILIWRLSRSWLNLMLIAIICISPITPHIKWAHSEIFCFASIILGLGLTQSKRWRDISPIFLGLGAAQNIPIILTIPLHIFLTITSLDSHQQPLIDRLKMMPRRLIFSYLVAVLLPMLIGLQNYYNFGSWNLISALNQASLSNITVTRIKSVLFSPQIGALLYFPAAWFAIVLSCLSGRLKIVGATVLCSLAMVIVSSTTANINSAQLSATRYSVWTLSPLYLLPLLTLTNRRVLGRIQAFLVAASIVCVMFLVWWLGSYRFLKGDLLCLFSLNRARPEIASLYRWTNFDDDIEPLVENLQRAELRVPYTFSKTYIWNLGDSRSLWIISKRSHKKLGPLRVRIRSAMLPINNSNLSELFHVSTGGDSEEILTPRSSQTRGQKNQKRVNLDSAKTEEIRWRRNPYWGSYKILWIPAEVAYVDKPAEVLVKEADGSELNPKSGG